MVREDLITNAISFLQDPSVASSPLDTRRSFLRSKNLTAEEIDVALARASSEPPSSQPPQASYSEAPARQPFIPPQQYGQYPPPWAYGPPPPPRRDWRDIFILLTLSSLGLGTLYTLAKRYLFPLILPPTPPQLTSDKAAIDASFARAFTLIETLSQDTEKLKAAEEERGKRLDTALKGVEDVIKELREGVRRREEEGRRLRESVDAVKGGVERGVESWREGVGERVREVGSEVKGLRILVSNRMGVGQQGPGVGAMSGVREKASGGDLRKEGSAGVEAERAGTSSPLAGLREGDVAAPGSGSGSAGASGAARVQGKARIPAWQMAQAKVKDGSEGGSAGSSGEEGVGSGP